MEMVKKFSLILALLLVTCLAQAADEELQVIESAVESAKEQPAQNAQTPAGSNSTSAFGDPLKYTLGADDVIEITVMRHPEFSGVFPINKEGKVQYKFVGDITVSGLNKKQLEEKISGIISAFVIGPEVNISILEYKSKVFYVLGEVGYPGKFYMMSESIPVREAIVMAGLPTVSAAMRKCRILTPDTSKQPKIRNVDLYSLLYGGNLKKNLDMHPGDVLYVPSTIMAKVIRVINPVAQTVGVASSGPSNVSAGKSAVSTLAK